MIHLEVFFGCKNNDDWIGGMAQLASNMCGKKMWKIKI
jgi:hypothetical protein